VRGYWLARSGRRVLFVEKGRSTLPWGAGNDSLFDALIRRRIAVICRSCCSISRETLSDKSSASTTPLTKADTAA
jgi:hypothetical protein